MDTILIVKGSENEPDNKQYSLQAVFASKALRTLRLKSSEITRKFKKKKDKLCS